jgi:predicted Zn-dependent protease with MMP-like domain
MLDRPADRGAEDGEARRPGISHALSVAVTTTPSPADNGLVIEVQPDRFEEMVVTALDGLPDDLGKLMRNVAVTVEHGPGPRGLLGLYQGVPLTSRGTHYAGVLPDRITIYHRAICMICSSEAEVVEQVRRTVVHEVAHHFGIGDERLRELGW